MEDKLSKLYQAVKTQFGDTGTEDQFREKLQDVNSRKKLHTAMWNAGFSDVGRWKDFDNKIKSYLPNSDLPINELFVKEQTYTPSPYRNNNIGDVYSQSTFTEKKEKTLSPSKPQSYATPVNKLNDNEQKMIDRERKAQIEMGFSLGELSKKALKGLDSHNESKDIVPDFISNLTAGQINTYPGMSQDEFNKETVRHHDYSNFKAAQDLIDQSKDIITEAKKKGDTSFFSGVARGVRDKGFDIDTWSFGITDAKQNASLLSVVKKADKGAPLSEGEQTLLDAAVTKMATEAYYSSNLGRGYKAGGVAAESVPFMLELAFNPAQAAGHSVGSSILRYGLKRLGVSALKGGAKKVARVAIKGAARAASDAVGMAAVTGSSSLGRITADAEQRQIGTIKHQLDENGNIVYAGREDKEDIGTAIVKAAKSTYIDNFTEAMGGWHSPIGKVLGNTKVLRGIKASQFGQLMSRVSSTDLAKKVDAVRKATKNDGILGEYVEELYGTAGNAAFVGDQKFSDLTDPDKQLDTFLGVAVIPGFMSGIKTGGYVANRYSIGREFSKATTLMTKAYDTESTNYMSYIDNLSVGERSQLLHDINSDNTIPSHLQYVTSQYIINKTKHEALISGVKKQATDAAQEAVDKVTQDVNIDTNEIVVGRYYDGTEDGREVSIIGGSMDDSNDFVTIQYTVLNENGEEAKQTKQARKKDIEDIQSSPAAEIIEDARQKAKREVELEAAHNISYSSDIPTPQVGQVFTVNGNNANIIQVQPDGIVYNTTDEKGDVVSTDIMSNEDYYDRMQDAIEQQEDAKDGSSIEQENVVPQEDSNKEEIPQEKVMQDKSNHEGPALYDAQPIKEIEETPISETKEQQNIPAIDQIQKDEKGNFMFENHEPELTRRALDEIADTPEDRNEMIDATLVGLQKEYDKVVSSAIKPSTDINKTIAEKQAKKQNISDLQKRIEYWNTVKKGNTPALQNETQPTEEKAPVTKLETKQRKQGVRFGARNEALGDYISLRDYLLRNIATGTFKFIWKDNGVKRGLASEMGFTESETERKHRFWMLSKDGFTPENLAEHILGNTSDIPKINEDSDTQDIRNEIIDICQSFATPSSMMEEAERMHQSNEKNNEELEKETFDAAEEKRSQQVKELSEEREEIEYEQLSILQQEQDAARKEILDKLDKNGIEHNTLMGIMSTFDLIDYAENELNDLEYEQISNERRDNEENGETSSQRNLDEETEREVSERQDGGREGEIQVSDTLPREESLKAKDVPDSITLESGDNSNFELDIDYNSAVDAYRNVSFNPEKRAKRFIENYVFYMESTYKELENYAITDEQKALLIVELEKFRAQSKSKHLALLSATSRTASAAITGAGNFPVAKNQKALEVENKRLNELIDWKESVIDRIKAKIQNAATAEMKQNSKNEKLQVKYNELLEHAKKLINEEHGLTTNSLLKQAREREILNLAKENVDLAKKLLNEINAYAKNKKGKEVFTDRHSIHKKLDEIKQSGIVDEAMQNTQPSFNVEKRKDTRNGADIFIAKPSHSVSSDTFSSLKEKAKENNGYYSKFTKGFLFKTQEDANNFVNSMSDENTPTTEDPNKEAEDGLFQVYKIERNNGSIYWAVSGFDSDGKPKKYNNQEYDRYGDNVYDSEEEAIEGAVRERKLYEQNERDEKKREESEKTEREKEELEAKVVEEKYKEFTSGMSPLEKHNTIAALEKRINFQEDGGVLTIEQFISMDKQNDNTLEVVEEKTYKGASKASFNKMSDIEQERDKKRVEQSKTKTTYIVNGYNLGKVAYNYAQFINEKNKKSANSKDDFTDRQRKIENEISNSIDNRVYETDKKLEAKRKEYESAKKRFGSAYSEDAQSSLFNTDVATIRFMDGSLISGDIINEKDGKLTVESGGRKYTVGKERVLERNGKKIEQQSLFEVARDTSQKNAESILNPIKSEIETLEKERKDLLDGKQKRIDDAVAADKAQQELFSAREQVDTKPTEAQKEAGNYQKGHVTIQGLDITIENPKDSKRSGIDENGKEWSVTMHNDYGYFKRTEGKDGDHIDVFIGNNLSSELVFVVDQVNEKGFDEHKVMLGFDSSEDAKESYMANYDKDWKGFGAITEIALSDFKKWLDIPTKKSKAFADYKIAKSENNIIFDNQINEKDEVSKSIPQGRHRKETEGDRRIEEALTECKRRSQKDIRDAQRAGETISYRQRKEIEDKATEQYAKENSMWIPMQDVFSLGEPSKGGNENDVYLDVLKNTVFKVNNLLNSKSITSFLNRLLLHNEIFPETRYELVGFSGFGNRDVYPIIKQDYITNSAFATPEEIDEQMNSLGFSKIDDAKYSNDDIIVSDLRPRNVLKNTKGSIYVIDAEFERIKNEIPTKKSSLTQSESSIEKIEDFGNKIGGAKKDLYKNYISKVMLSTDEDIANSPLSKVFPKPNLKSFVENGAISQSDAIVLSYLYENIPPKPRKRYKLNSWVKQVKDVRDVFNEMIDGKVNVGENLIERFKTNSRFNDLKVYYDVYKSANFPTENFSFGQYKVYNDPEQNDKYFVTKGSYIIADNLAIDEVPATINKLNSTNTKSEIKFSVYKNRRTNDLYITPKGKSSIIIQNGFNTADDAFNYIKDNYQSLVDKYNNMRYVPEERRRDNKDRQGSDWRNGKDILVEEFDKAFKFRGVEFGNWVNQKERQQAINEAYDALMDLSSILGVSPSALSLNGELAFAFGARGSGKANAHYEPNNIVINITKTRGAGSVAHEWFHALDNYFSRMDSDKFGYVTDRYSTKGGIRNEMFDAFKEIKKSFGSYAQRGYNLDKMKGRTYWGTTIELAARAFENYIITKLGEKGISNDYLANFKSTTEFLDDIDGDVDHLNKMYPYPFEEEAKLINDAFDKLFGTIQEKVDEKTGNSVLFRESEQLSNGIANNKFNKELEQFISGKMRSNEMFHIGKPLGVLRYFLPDIEIVMRQSILHKGIEKKHNVDIDKIKDLPSHISNPIFIFQRNDKAIGILTEIEDKDGKNVCVAIELNKTIQNGGKFYEVNDLRSFHGREIENIIKPINLNGSLRFANIEKGSDWITSALHNFKQAQSNQNLSEKDFFSAAKIVQEFRNPTLKEGEISSEIENLTHQLGSNVRVIRNLDEITDKDKRQEKKKRGAKGWYDMQTGEVVIVLPNATSIEDVQATIMHEIVAHKGMRGLLGDKFDDLCDKVFDSLSKEVQDKLKEKHKTANKRVLADEYMASLAEDGVDSRLWERIKALLRDAFRSLGVNLKMNDADIKYLLWKSKNKLEKDDISIDIAKKIAKDKSMKSILFREDKEPNNDVPVNISNIQAIEAAQIITTQRELNSLRATLNGRIKTDKIRESYQDRMISVRRMIELIEESTGEKVPDWMNPYIFENQISSISTYEAEEYDRHIFKPLISEINRFADEYRNEKYKAELESAENTSDVIKLSHNEAIDCVYNYMLAKHGLERNAKMREKELEDYIASMGETIDEADIERKREDIQYKDYSGLTALAAEIFGKDEVDKKDVEDIALDYVSEIDELSNSDVLWGRVKDSTTFALKKQMQCGLLDQSTYDMITSMYEFYVPLRGWSDTTAEDVYNYIGGKNNVFTPVNKTAKGRKSKADNPIAYIKSLAESAIVSSNKNAMKQRMLWLCRKYKQNGLFGITHTWEQNMGTEKKPAWVETFPDFSPKEYSLEEIKEKTEAFYQNMEELQAEGKVRKRGSRLSVGMSIKPFQAKEHQIEVYENGKKYIINVNSDPTIAQAINGLNNGDYKKEYMKWIGWANRQMAANFTTRNPAFVIANLIKDLGQATTIHSVREGASYSVRFIRNVPRASSAMIRYLKNTQDLSRESDRYLKEFFENGGETGYFALEEIDNQRRRVEKELKKFNKTLVGKATEKLTENIVIELIRNMNRWAECNSRAATYMTSRQDGRSVIKSIADAKNVTVNFNRKGSGMVVGKEYGKAANAITGVSSLPRELILFFNAAIQGLQNLASATKKNPIKMGGAVMSYMTIGAIMPILNSMMYAGGDDKDKYEDIPEYARRSNFIIMTGSGYIKIPLPLEFKAFYAIGEATSMKIMGKDEDSNYGLEVVDALVNSFSPIDAERAFRTSSRTSEGKSPYVGGLLPSAFVPIYELLQDEDFTGKQITSRYKFNRHDPEFKRAGKHTNQILVQTSRMLNHVGGGDDIRPGIKLIDINPSFVEHILNGYLGGMGTTVNQMTKCIYAPIELAVTGKTDFGVRDIPVVSRFYADINQGSKLGKLKHKYYNLIEQLDAYKYYNKQYKETLKGDDRRDALHEFKDKDMLKNMIILKLYKKNIDKQKEAIDNAKDQESFDNANKKLEKTLNKLFIKVK